MPALDALVIISQLLVAESPLNQPITYPNITLRANINPANDTKTKADK